jgi:hypothetical protein
MNPFGVLKYFTASAAKAAQVRKNPVGLFGGRFARAVNSTRIGKAASIGLWGGLGATVGGYKEMRKVVTFDRNGAPDVRQGNGYITWAKGSGMQANNLSSNGIGLSLNKLRHTSII